jgi:hypothetical protein
MSNQKQSITKPFSRLKNGLVELQRWWPAFVKNDGVGGLTVDPMLYSTGFGPNTKSDEGGLNSENDTPGVRVEAINDDGTVAKGDDNSEVFTVTISGAGTFAPLCEVSRWFVGCHRKCRPISGVYDSSRICRDARYISAHRN